MDDLILCISPLGFPDPNLIEAVCRVGALGILDLGDDSEKAKHALHVLSERYSGDFGALLSEETLAVSLPQQVRAVVIPKPSDLTSYRAEGRKVFVQVCSLQEARAAESYGSDGLIVKGWESAGRIGTESTFVLLQGIAGAVAVPIWAQGGIGLHTAGAAIAAGAKGVVLDSQLSLLSESRLPDTLKRIVAAMDGSETSVIEDFRMLARPGQTFTASGTLPERIPLGQDGAFAKPLADRFHAIPALIRGLRHAIEAHIHSAQSIRPLARNQPLARFLGTIYPIVQGPMSSVSDCPAFTRAVFEAGGMPFIALSSMTRDQAARLLAETREQLGDRPWGVGLLGFLPPDLFSEQLGCLKENRAAFAIVAGGNPSQVRRLERLGIETFLHVPSIGLLDLFFKEGVRKFVFEGRECGGHVGPLTGFVLWENAVDRLLNSSDVRDTHVLFAGGIHDAKSGAMVSTIAAPIAARGAKVGIVMGSAYLFTEEAVRTGAILAGYQEAALACEQTVVLESSPGHAVRSLVSQYVDWFRQECRRLEVEKTDLKTAWTVLEQSNLGRLRIAAKGEKLIDGRMQTVDASTQKREGLFMIGQVATLRREPTTLAELHREVSDGTTLWLSKIVAPKTWVSEAKPLDIAIIGMACVFPDAENLDTYWRNILLAKDCIAELPESRWNKGLYYDPEGKGEKTPSKWGGVIPDILFDPTDFGIVPHSLAAIDPTQLLSLLVVKRALDDASLDPDTVDRERVSVIFGTDNGSDLERAYSFRILWPQLLGQIPPELDAHLPVLSEDSFAGVLTNIVSGRIANRLDFGSANYTVNAACASSLLALDAACKELISGFSDIVIAGGADLHNTISDYLMFASVQALSPTGRCATFDASADGTVLGEGVAAIILKRLEDAQRDGDRIYAVIKGIGTASDGRTMGLTAPNKQGQTRALERAYHRAGISPRELGLIEAHGTGTRLGDRTELTALTDFMLESGAERGSCVLGSIKSQIGHTKCASGIAGIIKAALSIYYAVKPPTGNIESPNPFYHSDTSPFVFQKGSSPWLSDDRKAGISALGFGGTNFHVVIEGTNHTATQKVSLSSWPAELFLFRGQDRYQANRRARQLAKRLTEHGYDSLTDLAAAVTNCRVQNQPVQIALVAESKTDLREKIARLDSLENDETGIFIAPPKVLSNQVAFVFPGQGSQRLHMLSDLFVVFPRLRIWLARGSRYASYLFVADAFDDEQRRAQKRAIDDTRIAQPTLGIVNMAMADLLSSLGIKSTMACGHSYGELVALTFAGSIEREELIDMSIARAQSILEAVRDEPGTMVAVSAPVQQVEQLLSDCNGVVIANRNAPRQTVISGTQKGIDVAIDRLRGENISVKILPVSCAFHSPIVGQSAEGFRGRIADTYFSAPQIDVWSSVTAQTYPGEAEAIRTLLCQQLVSPVRFEEQIRSMYKAGARVFIEVGPGDVLTDLIHQILEDQTHWAIPTDRRGVHGLRALLDAVAQLAVLNVSFDPSALFKGRDFQPIDLTTSDRDSILATSWVINGQTARPLQGELPGSGFKPNKEPLRLASFGVTPPENAQRQTVILEYIRSMQQIVESQRQAVLSYLGQAPESMPFMPNAELNPRSTVPKAMPQGLPVMSREGAVEASAVQPLNNVTTRPIDVLTELLSERTGYPVDMLEPDLDLEADLGIDSIKRTEILASVCNRLGLWDENLEDIDALPSELIEEFAMRRTLRSIGEWFEKRINQATDRASVASTSVAGSSTELPSEDDVTPSSHIERFVLEAITIEPAVTKEFSIQGRRVAIADDGNGIAQRLSAMLESRGAHPVLINSETRKQTFDDLIFLSLLGNSKDEPMKSLFDLARKSACSNSTRILGATALGGRFGLDNNNDFILPRAGVAGFLRSMARENPGTKIRTVDLNMSENTDSLAEYLMTELMAEDDFLDVGYQSQVRYSLNPVMREKQAAKQTIGIGTDSVVLITGGARGITALVAISLAQRFGCQLEIVGRTPIAVEEEPVNIAVCRDMEAVRRELLRQSKGRRETVAEIETRCRAIMRAREMRSTFKALDGAGVDYRYHCIDVRDDQGFAGLFDEIYQRRGRLDGVIHGAGIVEDSLLDQKSRESFDRVYQTKVKSANTIINNIREDVRFIAFFSSVSAVFGSRGQTDYAAANDYLDKLAWYLTRRTAIRAVSINWGPWGNTGMVTPELSRHYRRQGIGMIAPEKGVDRFIEELLLGNDPQVIFSAPSEDISVRHG
ncbi:MAG: SDR family NAD(P)-dependent oxidoreductase [Deltaproteobacteria bacterium]|nr:SDR family NAD(P)-dependent oxidoreductase [Deltaproteobacteria bacterium]